MAESCSPFPQDVDAKIEAAHAPIRRLEEEYQRVDAELSGRITEAQRISQELNMSVDRLDGVNKLIDRCGMCSRHSPDITHTSAPRLKIHPREAGSPAQGMRATHR